jgi:hypothetical protein
MVQSKEKVAEAFVCQTTVDREKEIVKETEEEPKNRGSEIL